MFHPVTSHWIPSVFLASAHIGPNPRKIFAGNYHGITEIENKLGEWIFYNPVRFTVNKAGEITGTARNYKTGKLLAVQGSIGKVSGRLGIRFLGTASGSFSDGTTWTAEVEAMKGVSAKGIQGPAKRDGYSGTVTLTNL